MPSTVGEERIHYTSCPVCKSTSIAPLRDVKDFSVSGEIFPVWRCRDCSLCFTQDVPGPAAIGPYYRSENYVSHTATRKGIVNRLYHVVRGYTLNRKRELVGRVARKGALLDVGAGTGAFAAEMKAAGWQVTALEPDEGARSVARSSLGLRLDEPGVLYALAAASFDAITLWHVLEHVHDLSGYFRKFHEILRSGGALVIAVPNHTSYDAGEYGEYWAAWDVPRHLYHFSPDSMDRLASDNGFKVVDRLPMWFDSYYVCLLSEKYRSGNAFSLRALNIARKSNARARKDPARCSSVIYVLHKAVVG